MPVTSLLPHFLLPQVGQRGSCPFPELLGGGAHLCPGGGAWTGGCTVAAKAERKPEPEGERGEERRVGAHLGNLWVGSVRERASW